MSQQPSVYAVIIAYNPDLEGLSRNINAVTQQVSKLYIWDNSAPAAGIGALSLPANVVLIENEANSGIADPLNTVAARAFKEGARWLLTLDQDSVLGEGYVDQLFGYIENHPDQRLASLGGQLVEHGHTQSTIHGEGQEVSSLITSGNLIRLDAWKSVGGFDDALFIDGVDHDFSLKLRSQGYCIVQVANATIEHTIGTPVQIPLFGTKRVVTCSNHSALRRYYSTRNRLMLYSRYWRVDPAFICRDIYALLAETAKIFFFEKEKRRKFRAIYKGAVDAFSGTFGKCEHSL